jgi:hypothetical protein
MSRQANPDRALVTLSGTSIQHVRPAKEQCRGCAAKSSLGFRHGICSSRFGSIALVSSIEYPLDLSRMLSAFALRYRSVRLFARFAFVRELPCFLARNKPSESAHFRCRAIAQSFRDGESCIVQLQISRRRCELLLAKYRPATWK